MSNGGWGKTRFKRAPTCHPGLRHYARGLCKDCYRRSPEMVKVHRAYYRDNKHRWQKRNAEVRAKRLREAVKYGISPADQEAMLEQQDHLCAICRQPPGKKRLAVDHDHETGKVRGMLCGRCNTALGGFRDNPELCERAASYLRHHSLQAKKSAA